MTLCGEKVYWVNYKVTELLIDLSIFYVVCIVKLSRVYNCNIA